MNQGTWDDLAPRTAPAKLAKPYIEERGHHAGVVAGNPTTDTAAVAHHLAADSMLASTDPY
jgi:hypothetical protein